MFTRIFYWLLLAFASEVAASVGVAAVLPGTQPLQWPETEHADMADRLMDGAHRFVDGKIEQARGRRARYWQRDFSSGDRGYEASIAPNRSEFKRLIGAVDERLPVVMERFGDERNPALVAETDLYRVFQVRWSVLDGVWGEGLLVEPTGRPAGYAVVVPDAELSPEQYMGLAEGIAPEARFARRLVEQGIMLVIPTLVQRAELDPDLLPIPEEAKSRLARSHQTYREWLYRQAYHMGRHVIGYEVQKISAAAEWLRRIGGPEAVIGVAGQGEGGLLAFYAAAADPNVDFVLVSGYFDSREQTWSEPVYRNVWALLQQFGDAEIATLIAPRLLVVEHSPVSTLGGHKGSIRTPPYDSVRREFERIGSLIPAALQRRSLIAGAGGIPVGPGSSEALEQFLEFLGASDAKLKTIERSQSLLDDRRAAFDPAARHLRQVRQISEHVQRLVRNSVRVRERFFPHKIMPEIGDATWSTDTTHETYSPDKFVEGAKPYRAYFLEEVMGRFEDQLLPANPRSRQIYESEYWTGYDVVLDVFEDLVAWGVLLVPRDIAPGERRPVVVTQHGRNGLPENLIVKDVSAYRRVAAKLADRGFVVFVPHNLYRTESRYRPLNRKASTIKATLYSFIVHQHDQILRWLNTLEFVDGSRIGFYGNSFGGETALRVPPVMEGYALSISASFFNQWTRKVAGTNDRFSFLFTDEWEVPVFNAGHTFDHAEMAYLMIPRPFMVERGHHDPVAHDRWVAHEYAKVRRLYAMLGLANRTEIEFFQGGHGMRLEGTLDFLHQHLDWPVR